MVKMKTKNNKKNLICGLGKIAKEGAKRAEKLGIKEKDVVDIIHRFRAEKRAKQ